MRPDRLTALWVLLACSVACEVGESPLASAQRLKLMSRAPVDSEGLDCDFQQSSCGVPANQPLSFTFDRWLLPSTATRQSLLLLVEGASYATFLKPDYELLTRTVRYRASGGLAQGLVHLLELNDASSHDLGWGFQAYDRVPLERQGLEAVIAFRTGPVDEQLDGEVSQRRVCRDAQRAFDSLGCTTCHQSHSNTAAGLGLDSGVELSSAVGRIAHSTDCGGEDGRVSVLPERFGMNMALIDPGEPAFSYLLYRLLLRRDAYRDEQGQFEVTPPADSELSFAEKWFNASGPMPPLSAVYPSGVSPVAEIRLLEAWIRDGADTTDCD